VEKKKSDIGVYGLGVMGRNLALNLEEKGFRVSVYNRSEKGEEHVTIDFLQNEAWGKNITGSGELANFIETLVSPRIVLLMVKAGDPVDDVISQLLIHLKPGDIVIDGGNSHFRDSERRFEQLSELEIHFVGMGVSGGEDGARNGPSLMPGGNPEAWSRIEPILKKISARNPKNEPCCEWIGSSGAGHFVKMTHNGIEYADMQLLAESYHLMKNLLKLKSDEIAGIFRKWNKGDLESYLVEITADIIHRKDGDGTPLLDKILDVAGQKGTGKWTAETALDLGIPLPLSTAAVMNRFASGLDSLRKRNAQNFGDPEAEIPGDLPGVVKELESALIVSRILSLTEGFMLIDHASQRFGWEIDSASVAGIWQGGCIIRSAMLKHIRAFFLREESSRFLPDSPHLNHLLHEHLPGLRNTVSLAVKNGIPVPGMSAAVSYFDTLRSDRLPLNLVQAQRDYFGSHQYERRDRERGEFYHTDWTDTSKM